MRYFMMFLLLCTTQLMALSHVSTIGSDEKDLVRGIVKKLKVPDLYVAQANKDVLESLESFMDYEEWYARWVTNNTLANTKVENSKTQMVDIEIINKNRITNVTFIYFTQEKQLMVSTKQFIPTHSSVALEHFEKRKKNDAYEKKSETDNYAFFKKKGYASSVAYLIDEKSAIINYFSADIYTYPREESKEEAN